MKIEPGPIDEWLWVRIRGTYMGRTGSWQTGPMHESDWGLWKTRSESFEIIPDKLRVGQDERDGYLFIHRSLTGYAR